jgi:uncharacterized protein
VALILDTSPLYVSLDRDDASYRGCRHLIEVGTESLVIPAPGLVEVDYWIQQRLHPGVLVTLLRDIDARAYRIEDGQPEDYRPVRELCGRYADLNIGFVDAAVLTITERLRDPKLATLDRRDFGTFRPRHLHALQLLPEVISV